MISKATAKFIKSLQLKKYRQEHNSFLVEGAKSVLELLESRHPVIKIVATDEFIKDNQQLLEGTEIHEVKPSELQSLGTFKTNNAALAVAKIVDPQEPDWKNVKFAVMLDGINDPGNLGTILRVADWYGIQYIIASKNTAEIYNPKVIAASKGSFLRIKMFYKDLTAFISEHKKPVIGTFMEGERVHNFQWPAEGYIVMGGEANGISSELEPQVRHKITIPGAGTTESLNVAIATAVVCDNWWRSLNG